MNRTPPPVSAASAAARMRSGVGEVKTWPGQAASSMPCPTKPVCSGSCPEPPPDTSATLPGLRCRRCTNGACSPRRTMSECAARNPARLSLTTFSAALISFFILPSPFAIALASGILDQPCDFLRELAQQRVKLVVPLFGPQIRQHQRETPAAFALFQEKQPARVRPVIGFKEPVPLLCREMADLDDGLHVLRRDRRLIGRVGNLRDETAILAEGFGQTLAHAGRPSIEHIPKDRLVGRDKILRARWRCLRAHAAEPE